MKHFLSLLLFLCAGVISAQETLPVVIDKAPFTLYLGVNNYDDFHRDIETVARDFPIYHIKKGTKVLVLSRNHDCTMMKVQLSDGSLGYMPTIAFIDKSDLTFTLPETYKNIPKGKYTFVELGKMTQKTESYELSVAPEYYLYRGENGQKYKINIGSEYTGGSVYDRITWFSYPYEADFLFAEFFKKHPLVDQCPNIEKVINFELKDGQLPVTFTGYSKSYIESIIGTPHSYAGAGLSQFRGYSFAYYDTVCWNTGSKRYNETGIIIYYDSELRAVHMVKAPLNSCRRKKTTTLYTPFSSAHEPDQHIADKIRLSERQDKTYTPCNPYNETYSFPERYDRIRLSSMYVIEQKIGLTPEHSFYRLGTLGILCLFLILIGLILNGIAPYIPASNLWIRIIIFTLHFPPAAFAVIYSLRFGIFTICISNIFFAAVVWGSCFALNDRLLRNKCAKCKSWLDNPIVVKKVLASRVKVSRPELGDYSKHLNTDSLDYTSKGVTTTGTIETRNHYTYVTLQWDITETLKCPHCGHTWKYNGIETKRVLGPICLSTYTKSQDSWDETTITTRRLIDKSTGEVLDEDKSKTTNRVSSRSSNTHYSYDSKRYNEYLNRYLNGDERALQEYYEMFFGKYDGKNWDYKF